ncbi:GGDEF domain-containing protein [Aestuariirhabdus litorea]|uniref:Sensor domain-containing diguanylate cyclase n=1 Tax=Aestuariirhabdus litorea TaxID=2528527 RepID=A0A3P3VLJ1_9GAMM|nr:sensor domain-containing diguanylate cyclase [Aestuariirhabdus litorea]RRJ82748.1 sensor domain-containing diguanylate cyclase [Aestuariirhabdus litorea]RWW92909.1 diguanylate cyclase [Endozoicomonadaceae bacterium GTF-13]
MKAANIPKDEPQRIAALNRLGVLDTPPEQRFDRITRMAKRIFGVPVALVSLVDSERQWFKSKVGLEVDETPRNVSFCAHAILSNELFMVPDATHDQRFIDNPLVVGEPHIRFYAACPLKAIDGSRVGTLCLIDKEPRNLDAEQQETLADLAAMVERELAAVELATMDELTGISNRRGFMQLGQHTLNLCLRQQVPATLVFLDIDHFKPINDRFGHAEGDRVLSEFAEQLRRSFRVTDLFARLGGDEFVVLLINADEALAHGVVAKLRTAVSERFDDAGRGYKVTFSHGVVGFDVARHEGIAELMNDADQLMYQCKQQRR